MSKYLRKNDLVVVIAGNDRGKTGKILSVKGDRVVIEGINIHKKHMKRTKQDQKGQILDIELPVHISNVKACVGDKAVKLRVREDKKGEKELFFLDENGKAKEYRSVKRGSK